MADDIERECGPAADGGWRCAPYAACTHPGGCLLADLADPEQAGGRGLVVPIAPDPARDARIDAYRDRERRRAVRALDRFIDLNMNGGAGTTAADVAGERFVEAVGDYVLARLTVATGGVYVEADGEFCGNRVEHRPHPWSDYGVPKRCDGLGETRTDWAATARDMISGDPERIASHLHQKADYGVAGLCVHGFIADGQACGEFGCTAAES